MRSFRGPIFEAQEFPAAPRFNVAGRDLSADEVIAEFGPMLNDERRVRIDAVVAARTRSIVPVLEGLYDRGNVNAVLRSAEALGYQAAHVIDTSVQIKPALRVTQGAQKWLDVEEWTATAPCLAALRARGFAIAVAHLGGNATIHDLDPTRPTAIVFGNEREGPSQELLDAADTVFAIPMSGFVESFNISVAAALCLYDIRQRRTTRLGRHGDLSETERTELTAAFYLRSLLPTVRPQHRTRK